MELPGEIPFYGEPIFDARYIDLKKIATWEAAERRLLARVRRAFRKFMSWFAR
jgi:hypothetical protein